MNIDELMKYIEEKAVHSHNKAAGLINKNGNIDNVKYYLMYAARASAYYDILDILVDMKKDENV